MRPVGARRAASPPVPPFGSPFALSLRQPQSCSGTPSVSGPSQIGVGRSTTSSCRLLGKGEAEPPDGVLSAGLNGVISCCCRRRHTWRRLLLAFDRRFLGHRLHSSKIATQIATGRVGIKGLSRYATHSQLCRPHIKQRASRENHSTNSPESYRKKGHQHKTASSTRWTRTGRARRAT